MNISRINNHIMVFNRLEKSNLQYKRDEDYRKVTEKKNIERTIADRVARNMRLDRDKGRNVDVEV